MQFLEHDPLYITETIIIIPLVLFHHLHPNKKCVCFTFFFILISILIASSFYHINNHNVYAYQYVFCH